MVQIANPIYDVVFKYLMEDKEAAKLLLSSIIQEQVIELDFLPQEYAIKMHHDSLTVFRMDFSAKIKIEDDKYKEVIIELQKAKFASDIMRFRRYLGKQYANKNNVYYAENKKDKSLKDKKALPIINIYFLGYKLDYIKIPVIQVKRDYYDAGSGKKLTQREDFIESLTHDSFVIQVSCLKEPYKSELESLLSIFDQHHTASSDRHILEIDDSAYTEKQRILLRRLQRAASEQEVRDTMDVEDDIFQELGDLERVIEEKDKALEEKDKIIQELTKVLKSSDSNE